MALEPITNSLTLDLIKKTQQNDIRYHQHDVNSAILEVEFQDNGEVLDITGANIRLALVKPDKTRVLQSTDDDPINPSIVIKDATTGKVEVTLLTQSLASPGVVYGEFEIQKDNITLVTQMFAFYVKGAILSDDSLQSTNFFPALQKAIDAGETLANVDLNTIVSNTDTVNAMRTELDGVDSKVTNLSNPPKVKSWTATQGQLIYKFDTDSYTLGQLNVYVGGVPQIPGMIVQEDSTTQFTLLVDASEITAGLTVVAVYR